jgi:F0F1-type ATP synthase membrane subunit b/b'
MTDIDTNVDASPEAVEEFANMLADGGPIAAALLRQLAKERDAAKTNYLTILADTQAEVYLARNAALEEAAKVAQSKWEDTGDHIADAIRALKDKT